MSSDPLIDARWAAEASPTSHLILPDGCLDLVERAGEVVVVGPMTRARWVRVAGGPSRGVRFQPGSASWLGVPVGELRDQVVALADLPVEPEVWRSEGDPLARLVAHGRTWLRRDPRVLAVRKQLVASPEAHIEPLAARVGWTPRHLRRRFEAEIGLSPRRFARIVRLQRLTVRLVDDRPLGELAFTCGFADQAHLSRDVKALTGLTPTALRTALQGGVA